MKTVGIIGGLGPETTSKFYLEVIFSCQKKNSSRPRILIWNVPIPLRVEKEFIKKAKGEEKFLPFLIEAAKALEATGADFIVMPCNSMHIFINEIRNSVKIPVLSIVDEVVKEVKKQKIKKVSLLATSTTFSKQLFQSSLSKNKIQFIIPQENDQKILGRIIHNIVTSKTTDKDRSRVTRIIKQLNTHTKVLILACTDLQLIVPKIRGVKIIDSMKVLANATVNQMKGDLRS